MALASIGAPKTHPTWDPKRGQHRNLKVIDFAFIYHTLATFKGAENHDCSVLFLLEPHFGMFFGSHFADFGSLLGYRLETILLIFGCQKNARCENNSLDARAQVLG